jgi:hypothetical protein
MITCTAQSRTRSTCTARLNLQSRDSVSLRRLTVARLSTCPGRHTFGFARRRRHELHDYLCALLLSLPTCARAGTGSQAERLVRSFLELTQ